MSDRVFPCPHCGGVILSTAEGSVVPLEGQERAVGSPNGGGGGPAPAPKKIGAPTQSSAQRYKPPARAQARPPTRKSASEAREDERVGAGAPVRAPAEVVIVAEAAPAPPSAPSEPPGEQGPEGGASTPAAVEVSLSQVERARGVVEAWLTGPRGIPRPIWWNVLAAAKKMGYDTKKVKDLKGWISRLDDDGKARLCVNAGVVR